MIYEISRELAARLKAYGCPIPVVYGPDRDKRTAFPSSRIVVERPRGENERFALGERSQNRNPPIRGVRWMAMAIRIEARSNVSGARVQDHERLADVIVDAIVCALHEIMSLRKNRFEIQSGAFLSAEALDLAGLKEWHGVIYELRIAIDRGIYRVDWSGNGLPTADLTGITNTTHVRLDAAASPETSCGG